MIYADLHVHIGRSLDGKPVKITAAKTLTLPQALQTADRIKGLSLLGIIDAHSLPKIAREFNLLKLWDRSFTGLKDLFEKKNGTVLKNFGLPPEMGKYHRSYCPECRKIFVNSESVFSCPTCHTSKVIPGVFDRVVMIADCDLTRMSSYVYHIPLMELPGVGPRTYQSLLKNFGNEIEILHEVPLEDLSRKVGEQLTRLIALMRKGEIEFEPGGGGIFGKIITP